MRHSGAPTIHSPAFREASPEKLAAGQPALPHHQCVLRGRSRELISMQRPDPNVLAIAASQARRMPQHLLENRIRLIRSSSLPAQRASGEQLLVPLGDFGLAEKADVSAIGRVAAPACWVMSA